MDSATSQRLETVEQVFELFNRLPLDPAEREASPVRAALLELFDPEVEFTQPALQPEGAQFFKGRAQLADAWDRWFEIWEHHRSQPERVVARGDRVLVLSRERLRARAGVDLDQRGAAIYTFKGEKIARFEAFFDHETARREFGAS